MKQIYCCFLLILIAFSGKAQTGKTQQEKDSIMLSIKPSQNGDTYMYVKKIPLYVNGGINLTKNNNKETGANLYFREDAQLLQGEGRNKGSGAMSIFQEGTSNAFDYDYWSLPVQSNGKKLEDVLFRPLENLESENATITSSLNGNSAPLQIAKRWIYKYSGNGYNAWTFIGNKIASLKAGEGFSMKGTNGHDNITINGIKNNPGSNQRYDFRGIPNNGEISVNVNKGNTVLIGNPYPSVIDLKKFLEDPVNKENTTGIAYFWDSQTDGKSHNLNKYVGGYGAYSPAAGGTYTRATFRRHNGAGDALDAVGSGKKFDHHYIGIGQGFMVEGKKNGGKVYFRNSFRVAEPDVHLKSSRILANNDKEALNSSVITTNNNSKVWLNVTLDNSYVRELCIAFEDDATRGHDKAKDAPIFDDLPADAAWNIEGEKFVIDVEPFNRTNKIPFSISVNKEMNVEFTIGETENMNVENIFLFDSKNNSYTKLNEDSYKALLPAGDFDDCFYLTFQDDKPTEEEVVEAEKEEEQFVKSIDIFQNNKQSVLQVAIPKDVEATHITVFDLNGAAVISKEMQTAKKQHDYSTYNLQDAIYIVQIKTADDRVVTKKISVKN